MRRCRVDVESGSMESRCRSGSARNLSNGAGPGNAAIAPGHCAAGKRAARGWFDPASHVNGGTFFHRRTPAGARRRTSDAVRNARGPRRHTALSGQPRRIDPARRDRDRRVHPWAATIGRHLPGRSLRKVSGPKRSRSTVRRRRALRPAPSAKRTKAPAAVNPASGSGAAN